MALLVGETSTLGDRIAAALEAGGRSVERMGPDHDDPFGMAAGHEAVIYLPAPSLQEPSLQAPSDESLERMQVALTAARAPGVEVLVVVAPLTGYLDELDLLAQDGVPYVVLRAPTLLEELAATLDGRRWLFVSKDATTRAIETTSLAQAIEEAIETEEQGRRTELAREPMSSKAALERAAAIAGKRIRVLAVWPSIFRALEWLKRLVERDSSPLALPAAKEAT